MGKRNEQTFHRGRNINDQQIYGKKLNMSGY